MMRNGVDLDRVNAIREAMRKDAAAGRRTLSGITSWNGGAHSTTIARNFAIPVDEPVALGGTDRGASPTELVLTALSACIAISIAYSAAEDGVEVNLIEIDVEGNLDLAGFLEVRRAKGPEHEKTRSVFEPRRAEGCDGSLEPELEKPSGFAPEHEKTRSVFEPRRAEGCDGSLEPELEKPSGFAPEHEKTRSVFEPRRAEGCDGSLEPELEKPSGFAPEHEKTRSVFEPRRAEGCDGSLEPELEKPSGFAPEHEKTRSVFDSRRSEGAEFEHRRCDSRQDVYPGLEEVRLTVRVDADAPREKIRELVDHGYRRSPVAAVLEGRVPIRVCIGWEETGTG